MACRPRATLLLGDRIMSFGSTTISTSESKVLSLQVSQSSQGLAIPLVWGTTRLPANLLWYDDFTAIPHTSTQSSGGKGGGATQTSTTYTYTAAFVLGLCAGTIVGVRKIWKDKETTNPSALGLEVHTGALGQSVWSYLTTKHPDKAIGYSGIAYVATGAFDLGNSSSPPNLAFEIRGMRVAGTSDDVAPADVLSDIATDPVIGVGVQSAQLGDLTNYRSYCTAMGFALSPAVDSQTSASQVVTDLMTATHSDVVWSEAKLKVIPYGDQAVGTWTPNVTPVYDLTEDHFLGVDQPIKVTRKRVSDAYNSVKIEYFDRANDYNVAVAEASDLAAIDRFGPRPMSAQTLHMICQQSIAETVASAILQRETNLRNTFEFQVDCRFGRLEPMDLVTLTHARLGMSRMPVRIVETSTNEDGDITITAEEWPFGVAAPARIPSQGGSGYIPDYNAAAGNANTPVIFEPPVSLAGEPQIWIGTSGGTYWGGAEVWVSFDGTKYSNIGEIDGPARHGITTAVFPSGGDPDNTNTLSVDLSVSSGTLLPATAAERDLYQSLVYVGGELVAYQGATLTGVYRYDLTNLRRGAYGTPISSHAVGSAVLRCDSAVFKYSYDPALVGKTIYIKLRSFNPVRAGIQDLASLTPIAYTVLGAPLGAVSGFTLKQAWVGRTLAVKWNAYPGASSYKLEFYSAGTLKRTITGITATEYSTTIGQLKADGLGRSVELRIYAVAANGQSSSASVLFATKAQIGAPTVSLQDSGGGAIVSCSRSADESYLGTRIWASSTSGFDPSLVTPKYDGPNVIQDIRPLTAGTWYVRAAQYDEFGPDSLSYTSEVAVTLIAIAQGTQRVANAATITASPGSAPPGGEAYWAVYDNATGKMARWDSATGRYVFAVSASDIQDTLALGSVPPIPFSQLTGYIGAQQVQTDSLLARHIALGDFTNLVADSGFRDPGWWTNGAMTAWPAGFAAVDGAGGGQPFRFLRISATGTLFDYMSMPVQVEQGAYYRVRLRMYISPDFAGWISPTVLIPNVGWPLPMPAKAASADPVANVDLSDSGFPIVDVAAAGKGGWISYAGIWQWSDIASLYLRTRLMGRVTAGYVELAFEIQRANDASLYVDGSITTNALAATTVNFVSAQGRQLVVNDLAAYGLSAYTANMGLLTSGQFDVQGYGGGWGYARSSGKWWADGATGWILARDASSGSAFLEFKTGTSRFWMSSWGDSGMDFSGKFSLSAGGDMTMKSALSGARTEITAGNIAVFNGSGVKQIDIGV
jgi:hypothetical protein